MHIFKNTDLRYNKTQWNAIDENGYNAFSAKVDGLHGPFYGSVEI